MELLTRVVPVNFNLFLFGDTHIGNDHVTYKGIQHLIEMMQAEYHGCRENYGVHMGDAAECIYMNDPRFRPSDLQNRTEKTLDAEVEEVVKSFKPVRHRVVTILKGNHEDKLWAIGNPAKRICRELGIPYGSYSCRVSFMDKRGNLLFKGFFEHGRKSISSTADDPRRRDENMRLILKRHLKDLAGDCVLMCKGDTHKLLICDPSPRLYLMDNGIDIQDAYTQAAYTDRYIHPDDRWYVNSGSFMRLQIVGSEGYAERAELPPVELGFAVMVFRDRKIVEIRKETL